MGNRRVEICFESSYPGSPIYEYDKGVLKIISQQMHDVRNATTIIELDNREIKELHKFLSMVLDKEEKLNA